MTIVNDKTQGKLKNYRDNNIEVKRMDRKYEDVQDEHNII